jgi:branched-chain amino acid transport system substrate-binding protein
MKMRKMYATLLPFAAAAVLAANAFAADPVKIGVAGAHSGDLASYGIPTMRAAELVAENINAKGGINGAKVELVIEDDVCKPETAANIAAKLVSAGVKLVIGHICSGATKAALPVYTESDVIVMSPSATDTDMTSGKYPTFYRTIAPNNAQSQAIVEFVTGTLKAQKIAIIHDKGDYGKGLAEDAQNAIRKGALASRPARWIIPPLSKKSKWHALMR